jgi:phospholipid/cholesterol/gamma-HCH transport system substrate-binding protein
MKATRFVETFIGAITLVFVLFVVYNFSSKYFAYKPSKYENYNYYTARFGDIDGLVIGSDVKLGGVAVGKLLESKINPTSYKVEVKFSVLEKYKLPNDSIISVGTNGLIGEKYLRLSMGNSNDVIKNNGEIGFTQSSLNLENLISLLKK